jgi:hypothetical protein
MSFNIFVSLVVALPALLFVLLFVCYGLEFVYTKISNKYQYFVKKPFDNDNSVVTSEENY